MKVSARARTIESSAIATRLFASQPSWLPQVLSAALAFGVLGWGASFEQQLGAAPAATREAHALGGISTDPDAKQAAREAKRAAREAKKKERASRESKSDDRSMAKAKSSKRSSGSSVDLGDNDPLDGL